jgi:DNA polymerase III delta subunit
MAKTARKSVGKSKSNTAYAPSADDRVVALCGGDDHLRTLRTRKIREALTEAHGEIEEFRFGGGEVAIADVLDECRSFGLMQQHKLVLVDDADELLKIDQNRDILRRYLEAPVEMATLVLRCASWGQEKKVRAAIETVGAFVDCSSPDDGTAVAWAQKKAQGSHEITLERPAAALLVERLGTSLGPLDATIAKLAAMARAEGLESITRDLVGQVVEATREEKAWEIQRELLSGSAERAVAGFRNAIGPWGHPPEFVAWVMIDLARKLHAAAAMLESGQNDGAVRSALRLFGSGAAPTMQAARACGATRCADLLREAVESLRRVRSGLGQTERSLELLALRFASVSAAPADTHRGR